MVLMLSSLLLSYFMLKIGFPISTPLIISIFIQIIYLICHLYDAHKEIKYNIKEYIKEVYLPILLISTLLIVPLIIIFELLPEGWLRFICIGITDVTIGSTAIYLFGFTRTEQEYIKKPY